MLLSDEEMLAISNPAYRKLVEDCGEDGELEDVVPALNKAVAKVQLKKIVDDRPREFDGTRVSLYFTKEEWQALLKEIE